ncbi:MAG: EAL domain-containing protein, partial [Deltaproteobacteria bacterium]|nr:EAL domain-containing protein [Deltaproteobacteria bacterium]
MNDKTDQPLILVADDEPIQLLLARQALESEGYLVETADNGREALELFAARRADMVLLDVMMPVMDGLTGLEDLDSIEEAYTSGATDFITKPLNWVILVQRVRYMLRASRAMSRVQKSEELLVQAQAIARLGNWEWDPRGDEMQWSAEIFRLLGAGPDLSPPTMATLLGLLHPEDRPVFRQALADVQHDRQGRQLELRTAGEGDKARCLEARIDVVAEAGADGSLLLVGTFQDITERRRALEKIRFLSSYDSLTGLPNRHYFSDCLAKAISRAGRGRKMVGVLVLNVDRFKRINDSLGSKVGDRLLWEIGKRLQKAVRPEDSLSRLLLDKEIRISRQGGDEFALLVVEPNQVNDLSRIARRLQEILRSPFIIDSQEIFLTASVGIAVFPADGADSATMLKNCEMALHHAKESGPGSCRFYSASMNDLAMEQLKLEAQLRTALEKGQFQLCYQPQVNIRQQRVTGAEALLRWQHPELGLVPPMKFIPLAEATGLINEIGGWVIRTACVQQVAWVRAGRPAVRMAVNVSAVQFQQGDLVDTVRDAISESGIDPAMLELELTESIIINESAALLETMRQLKSLGIRMVVDDFGTGYSSLRYLKHFPVDALKIDRCFIREVPANADDCALTEAMMMIADSLAMGVVVEGVETKA